MKLIWQKYNKKIVRRFFLDRFIDIVRILTVLVCVQLLIICDKTNGCDVPHLCVKSSLWLTSCQRLMNKNLHITGGCLSYFFSLFFSSKLTPVHYDKWRKLVTWCSNWQTFHVSLIDVYLRRKQPQQEK